MITEYLAHADYVRAFLRDRPTRYVWERSPENVRAISALIDHVKLGSALPADNPIASLHLRKAAEICSETLPKSAKLRKGKDGKRLRVPLNTFFE